MRAVWTTGHGGRGALEVRETPDPEPASGEVRIRVAACGLNFSDVLARQGRDPRAPRPPCVLGYEGAGVVDAVGSGVDTLQEQNRVVYLSRFGGHSSSVCVPASQAAVMPETMTFEQGAALPVDYLTAYHMLFAVANLRPGRHVLVHLAAGSVGTAVLQLCQAVENVTTYGTAPAGKHEQLIAQGCQHPIDYTAQDYAAEVRRLTQGRGVDLVLDPLGGTDWRIGYSLLRPAGMLIAYGMANVNTPTRWRWLQLLSQLARMPRYSPLRLLADNRAVAGVNVGQLFDQVELLRRELSALMQLCSAGTVKPQVGKCYPFSQACEAHTDMELGRQVGKVILVPE